MGRKKLSWGPVHSSPSYASKDSSNPYSSSPPPYHPNLLNQQLELNESVRTRLQEIFRGLHTRVPGGFQAEWLVDLLVDRHNGEALSEIRRSLDALGHESPYFREIQCDFQTLRNDGVTEAQLRKEWQGRG
nr:unnamed protein product [Ananas comosus var. bracteatus]